MRSRQLLTMEISKVKAQAATPERLAQCVLPKKEARRKGVSTDIYLRELLIQALKDEQATGRQAITTAVVQPART